MDMDVVISLKYGDFSERDPLIEVCVREKRFTMLLC